MTQPTQYYDFQGAVKELRIRINQLEEDVIRNQTRLTTITTISSLALGALLTAIAALYFN